MEKEDITLLKKYSDKEVVLRTLEYIKPVKKQFLLGIVMILFNVFLNILLPRVIAYYTDQIYAEEFLSGATTILTIGLTSLTYLIIILVNMFFTYLEVVIIQRAGQEVIAKMRQDTFEKIESLSHEQLYKIPVGKLVTRVTNDTKALNELYTEVVVNLFKYTITIVAVFVNMVMMNYLLALIILGAFSLALVATFLYKHFAQIAIDEERRQVSSMNTFLSENLNGIRITQYFNQETRKKGEFADCNKKLLKANYKILMVYALYRPFISFLEYGSIALVFWMGIPMVKSNASFFGTLFTYGALTGFYNYTVSFFDPIQNLTDVFNKLQSGIVSTTRILNILDMEPTIKDDEGALEIDSFKGKIEFKNVYFAYVGENWILEDVSFTVEPNQTVAFVGATGAGKTTILSLISRNYDIQKGQILIDGIDIRKIKISSLRKHIGQMEQDIFMFSGTVKDNITLQDEKYSDEDVDRAIKYVNADRFINKLERGIYSEVAERGANFSSGERQLISFARTVITKPNILFLDEATANIDTQTEVIIQDSLEKMKDIGTMLIVAHRLSTIQHADNIICLAKGKIIEQGKHQELLEKKGYYFKLYQLYL